MIPYKENNTQICKKCGIEKSLKQYYKAKENRLGIAKTCKTCDKKRSVSWYQKNKERCRLGRVKNAEKNRKAVSQWHKANPERVRKKNQRWKKQKRKKDPTYGLNCSISTAMWRSLKDGKDGKSWLNLVGYSLNSLIRHLEKQFTEGMTWENYGQWHIDHKIPISVFNFTKPEHRDFKRCWALKNLQPMWAKDNQSKSNKLDNHFQPSLQL